jgi:hypothetical protein
MDPHLIWIATKLNWMIILGMRRADGAIHLGRYFGNGEILGHCSPLGANWYSSLLHHFSDSIMKALG